MSFQLSMTLWRRDAASDVGVRCAVLNAPMK